MSRCAQHDIPCSMRYRSGTSFDHPGSHRGDVMKLCYALRRGVFYPSTQDLFGTMPPKEHRPAYLKIVKSYGFDGVEIPAASQAEVDAGAAKDFGQELKDAGLPALCVRAGGPI